MCIFRKGNKIITTTIFILGIISLIFGIIMSQQLDESQHSLMKFAGMLTGFGSGIAAVALFVTIRNFFSSDKQKKEREIKMADERNITLIQISYTAAAIASIILFAILSFVFCFQGFWFGTIAVTACMYIEAIVAIVTYKIMSTKM